MSPSKGRTKNKIDKEIEPFLKTLKIRMEDGSVGLMVQRADQVKNGLFIYLCMPCASTCLGESAIMSHIEGKKHRNILGKINAWPVTIYDEHPYNVNKNSKNKSEKVENKQPQNQNKKEKVEQESMQLSNVQKSREEDSIITKQTFHSAKLKGILKNVGSSQPFNETNKSNINLANKSTLMKQVSNINMQLSIEKCNLQPKPSLTAIQEGDINESIDLDQTSKQSIKQDLDKNVQRPAKKIVIPTEPQLATVEEVGICSSMNVDQPSNKSNCSVQNSYIECAVRLARLDYVNKYTEATVTNNTVPIQQSVGKKVQQSVKQNKDNTNLSLVNSKDDRQSSDQSSSNIKLELDSENTIKDTKSLNESTKTELNTQVIDKDLQQSIELNKFNKKPLLVTSKEDQQFPNQSRCDFNIKLVNDDMNRTIKKSPIDQAHKIESNSSLNLSGSNSKEETILQKTVKVEKNSKIKLGESAEGNTFNSKPDIKNDSTLATEEKALTAKRPVQSETGTTAADKKPVTRTYKSDIDHKIASYKLGPLIGLEYIVEWHYGTERTKITHVCTLCNKKEPSNIIDHIASYEHKYKFLKKHFPSTASVLAPFIRRPWCSKAVDLSIDAVCERVVALRGKLQRVHLYRSVGEVCPEERLVKLTHAGSKHITEEQGNLSFLVNLDLLRSADRQHNAHMANESYESTDGLIRFTDALRPIIPPPQTMQSPPTVQPPLLMQLPPMMMPPPPQAIHQPPLMPYPLLMPQQQQFMPLFQPSPFSEPYSERASGFQNQLRPPPVGPHFQSFPQTDSNPQFSFLRTPLQANPRANFDLPKSQATPSFKSELLAINSPSTSTRSIVQTTSTPPLKPVASSFNASTTSTCSILQSASTTQSNATVFSTSTGSLVTTTPTSKLKPVTVPVVKRIRTARLNLVVGQIPRPQPVPLQTNPMIQTLSSYFLKEKVANETSQQTQSLDTFQKKQDDKSLGDASLIREQDIDNKEVRRSADRNESRDRSRDKSGDRDRRRSRARGNDRNGRKTRNRSSDGSRSRSRDRSRYRYRCSDRNRRRSRDRSRERSRERGVANRSSRSRRRNRTRDKNRSKSRGRNRERSADRRTGSTANRSRGGSSSSGNAGSHKTTESDDESKHGSKLAISESNQLKGNSTIISKDMGDELTDSMVMELYENTLNWQTKLLNNEQAKYAQKPDSHPLYANECANFMNRRYSEISEEGADIILYDLKNEWAAYWSSRLEAHTDKALEKIKSSLRARLHIQPSMLNKWNTNRTTAAMQNSQPYYAMSDKSITKNVKGNNITIKLDSHKAKDAQQSPTNVKVRPQPPEEFIMTKSQHAKNAPVLDVKKAQSPLGSPTCAKIRPEPPKQCVKTERRQREITPVIKIEDDLSNSSVELLDAEPSKTDKKDTKTTKDGDNNEDYPLSLLRFLSAVEEYLGSLGPRIISLLTVALDLEKHNAGSSKGIFYDNNHALLLDTAKEKLKGQLETGLVEGAKAGVIRTAIAKIDSMQVKLNSAPAPCHPKSVNAPKNNETKGILSIGNINATPQKEETTFEVFREGRTDKSQLDFQSKTGLHYLQSSYGDSSVDATNMPPSQIEAFSDAELESLLKNFKVLTQLEQLKLLDFIENLITVEAHRFSRLKPLVPSSVSGTSGEVNKRLRNLHLAAVGSREDRNTCKRKRDGSYEDNLDESSSQKNARFKRSLDENSATPSSESCSRRRAGVGDTTANQLARLIRSLNPTDTLQRQLSSLDPANLQALIQRQQIQLLVQQQQMRLLGERRRRPPIASQQQLQLAALFLRSQMSGPHQHLDYSGFQEQSQPGTQSIDRYEPSDNEQNEDDIINALYSDELDF